MGSNSDESGRKHDEDPLTQVILIEDFFMGETEVTQAQWNSVMGALPPNLAFPGKPHNPVERVSWTDIMGSQISSTPSPQAGSFMARLSDLTGMFFTLPSEAQWEYACRAGSTTPYSFGDSDLLLDQYAWFRDNSGGMTHPVKTKMPNAWGLYDMHGNVWEWCLDWYSDKLPGGTLTSPINISISSYRINRGGAWSSERKRCRSANRNWFIPNARSDDLGFRVIATNR